MSHKILFFAADPTDAANLRLGLEFRSVDECRLRSKLRESYDLETSPAARTTDLRRKLLEHEPRHVHFSGHGQGLDGLAFVNDDHRTQLVSTDALAQLIGLFQGKIECVVLNACYSETQAKAIAKHVPFVVGMRQAIGDDAAIDFSVGYYDALFAGQSPDRAFEFGCNAIQLEHLPDAVRTDLNNRQVVPINKPVFEALPEHLKPVLLLGKSLPLPSPISPLPIGWLALFVALATAWSTSVFGTVGLWVGAVILGFTGVLALLRLSLARRGWSSAAGRGLRRLLMLTALVGLGLSLVFGRAQLDNDSGTAPIEFVGGNGGPSGPSQQWTATTPWGSGRVSVVAPGYLPLDWPVYPWCRNRVKSDRLSLAPYLLIGVDQQLGNSLNLTRPGTLVVSINGSEVPFNKYLGEYVLIGGIEPVPAWVAQSPKIDRTLKISYDLMPSSRPRRPESSFLLHPSDQILIKLKYGQGDSQAVSNPIIMQTPTGPDDSAIQLVILKFE